MLISDKSIHYHVDSYVTFAVIQNFDQIEQYISRCDHLQKNDELVRAENCSGKHLYKCVSGKHIKRNNTNQIKINVIVIHC